MLVCLDNFTPVSLLYLLNRINQCFKKQFNQIDYGYIKRLTDSRWIFFRRFAIYNTQFRQMNWFEYIRSWTNLSEQISERSQILRHFVMPVSSKKKKKRKEKEKQASKQTNKQTKKPISLELAPTPPPPHPLFFGGGWGRGCHLPFVLSSRSAFTFHLYWWSDTVSPGSNRGLYVLSNAQGQYLDGTVLISC